MEGAPVPEGQSPPLRAANNWLLPTRGTRGGLGFPPNPEASRQLMEPLGSVLFWEGRWALLGRGTGHRRLISYKGGHQVQGRRQWHNCPHPKSPIQPLPRHMGDCWVFSHGVEVLAIINEVISIKTPPWHGQVTSYLKEKKGERGGGGWMEQWYRSLHLFEEMPERSGGHPSTHFLF